MNTVKGDNHVVYMMDNQWGEPIDGPFSGEPGLDFRALADAFQARRFAECEAAGEDFCYRSESDFVAWLIDQKRLFRMEAVRTRLLPDMLNQKKYVPRHWPLCPECGAGRGDKQMNEERVAWALNRVEWYYECTGCAHKWGHHDEPHYPDRPMLDDDGRCIASGCVPYAISQAGQLSIERVLPVCRELGWEEGVGLSTERGLEAVRMLGLHNRIVRDEGSVGRRTLGRVIKYLSPSKNYILAVRGHWLAMVRGDLRDSSDTHFRTEVLAIWEVQPGDGS